MKMKKINSACLGLLATLFSISSIASQEQTFANLDYTTEENHCIAYLVRDSSPAGSANYSVDCGTEQFKTPSIMTAFWLPLPYNWKKVALTKLTSVMAQNKRQIVSKISNVTVANLPGQKDLLIFGPERVSNTVYCYVAQKNEKITGLDRTNKVWDVSFKYSSSSFPSTSYSGIGISEIETVLAKDGFIKTNIAGLYKRP